MQTLLTPPLATVVWGAVSDRVKTVSPSAADGLRPGEEDPLMGQIIDGRFHIRSLIARGGMGRVYRAEQSPLGRVCALKVVSAALASADPEYERRFKLEASTAAKLTHPNTVTVFDYGKTDGGIYYMAMELLEGRTLHKVLRSEGSLAPERAVRIASQICRSLREAHHHGVVHRDLKPANVFLVAHGDEPDFVKVLDFGLVKALDELEGEQLTQTGIFMGSPKYMAPEQIEGNKIDARTDVYSLGVMLYEMLTGKVPFDKATSVKTLMAHVHDPVPPLSEMAGGASFPSVLEDLVQRCLGKVPQERPSSMEEVLTALRQSATALAAGPQNPVRLPLPPIAVPPPPSSSQVHKRPPSNPIPAPPVSAPVSSQQVTKMLHGEGKAIVVPPPARRKTDAAQLDAGRRDATTEPPASVFPRVDTSAAPLAESPARVSTAAPASNELRPVAESTTASLRALGRSRKPSRALIATLAAFSVTVGGGAGLLAVRLRAPKVQVVSPPPSAEPVHSAMIPPPVSTSVEPVHSAGIPSAEPVHSAGILSAEPVQSATPSRAPAKGGKRRLPTLPKAETGE